MQNIRMEKGKEIAETDGHVKKINDEKYLVKSQSNDKYYAIRKMNTGWRCNCPDQQVRGIKCKHIWAVEISYQLHREIVKQVISPVVLSACPTCLSEDIVKHGIRHNKYGDLQRFTCKVCGHRFTLNLGFEKMHASPHTITSVMQLYFTQESLRNIQKFLKLQRIQVSHVTVYNWVKKYVQLMDEYMKQITPSVSDTWRADEVWVKVNGNRKYVFALMDDETRFYLAQEVAESKTDHDARDLFHNAKLRAGKRPSVMITDGLPSYHDAFNKEFYSNKRDSIHINSIKLSGDMNNNTMERANGEFRDREKVTRGLKKNSSPMISGYEVYHNYIKPHMGLENKTPAEMAGIEIEGDNKWITIIQNAKVSKERKQ